MTGDCQARFREKGGVKLPSAYSTETMATVKILNTHKELNEYGCRYFLETSESHVTRVTSTELRWLTVRKGDGGFFTPAQEEACSYIDDLALNYESDEWDKINMKILLYIDPTVAQHPHIIKLLKCGAEIRYVAENNTTKVLIQDNELYLTFSSSKDKVVNSGIVYIGNKVGDPLVNHYVTEFDHKFATAKRIILKKGKIVYQERGLINVYKTIKSYETKDWLNLILGAILGALFGLSSLLFQ